MNGAFSKKENKWNRQEVNNPAHDQQVDHVVLFAVEEGPGQANTEPTNDGNVSKKDEFTRRNLNGIFPD